jgi:hypothetical protein
MDVEIGRIFAELGLGTLKNDGKTLDKLTLGNTMIVDGNGKVDAEDVAQMTRARSSCTSISAER